ncbi:hypothetical protein ACRRTK_020929 [Alexandromys fortis]
MTTVTVTTEVPPRHKTEDNSVLCTSSSAHILEETEYVRKIRTTLEKIRNHMFKDEAGQGNVNCKRDSELSGNLQNGPESTTDPAGLDLLMENMRRKDQQLLEMNRENEVLKIKLEASREAGAAALRNVAQRLFDNYQTHSEDTKKRHEDSKRFLQINNLKKEQMLKQRVENLSELSEKLEEKHGQIIGLENRVQRMENIVLRSLRVSPGSSLGSSFSICGLEPSLGIHLPVNYMVADAVRAGGHITVCAVVSLDTNRSPKVLKKQEKKTLLERKSCLESKLLQLKSKDSHSKSCQDLEAEISILQEQICHLQFVIHSQHQNLRNIIQEVRMEGLKSTLKEQDGKIENLKEKVNILESQAHTGSMHKAASDANEKMRQSHKIHRIPADSLQSFQYLE